MDKDTFSNDSVVAEMKDVLCYNVDTESEAGRPIAKKYGVGPLPTLLFLEPDGSLRDLIIGYRPPKEFMAEVGRIKRDEGTISGLKKKIEANPKDLEARYDLATKFKDMGDTESYEAQVAKIRELDPEGTSVPSRRLALAEILAAVPETMDITELHGFLAKETHPELLYDGWYTVWRVEDILTRQAEDDEAKAAVHRGKWLAAAKKLWSYVPQDEGSVAGLGNQIAWNFYENRAHLNEEDLEFALDVAMKAVKAAKEDANVIDTLACLQFVTGRTEEALANVRRCIELDPKNGEWQRRLEEFTKS